MRRRTVVRANSRFVDEVSSVGTRAQRLTERLDRRRARARRSARTATAVVVAIGSGFVGVTAASAYFASSGSGSGSATAATVQAVTASGAIVSNLIPDGTGHDVTLTVTNPNAFPVTLESVIGNGTILPDSPGHTGCGPTGVTFADQTGLSQSIPGGSVPTPVTLDNAARMDNTSVDACQGATFTIPVMISVQEQ
jgi:hypothetical protein